MNQIAEKKALSIYHNFYDRTTIEQIPPYECIFPDNVFIKILNDVIVLSQQKIEDRLINTKIIFIDNDLKDLGCPDGFNYIPIKKRTFNSLDLSNFKRFLEMTSDSNSFLLISVSKENNEEIAFSLIGFIFIDVSMNYFISHFERSKMYIEKDGYSTINEEKIIKKLKCTLNSIFCKIKNGGVEFSYFNKVFLKILKGMLIEPFEAILDVRFIISFSNKFFKKLISFDKEDLRKIPICCLSEHWDSYNEKSLEGFNRFDQIYCLTLNSLTEVILELSESHHGTTMVFGFKGDIRNEEKFQPNAIELNIPYGDLLLEFAEDEKKDQEILQTLKTYEKAIISLSKTDGAMIFNSNLNLVSVGTFFKVKSSATSLSSEGGARLKSAEGFIDNNNDTIAFVISQDGTIHFIQKKYIQDQLKNLE